MKRIAVCICAVMLCTIPVSAGLESPFSYYNLYSAGDIGTSTQAYGSDVQGTIGAGGDVYFSYFSADDHLLNDYGLHVGGSATLVGGSYYKNVEVGGNLSMQSLNIEGDVYVGGNVTATTGGTINGNLSAAGTITMPQYSFSVTGTTSENMLYSNVVNFDVATEYFTEVSSYYGGLTETTSYENNWGGINVELSSGLNIVAMSADEFKNAWGLTVSGATDGVLVINLTGEIAELDSTTLAGIDSSKVLLNYVDASSLSITGGNTLNILAINADTNFAYGHVDGNLIVANLTGSGQVNEGFFDPGTNPVPEPCTIAILALGALMVNRPRSKRKA